MCQRNTLCFSLIGLSEQKPEDWFEQTMAGLKELVSDCDKASIAGISFGESDAWTWWVSWNVRIGIKVTSGP